MADRFLFDFDFLLLHSCYSVLVSIGFVVGALPEPVPVSASMLPEREPVSMPVSATVLLERESIAPVVGVFAVGYSECPLVEDIDSFLGDGSS